MFKNIRKRIRKAVKNFILGMAWETMAKYQVTLKINNEQVLSVPLTTAIFHGQGGQYDAGWNLTVLPTRAGGSVVSVFKALSFYGNPETYSKRFGIGFVVEPEVISDTGAKAREAMRAML